MEGELFAPTYGRRNFYVGMTAPAKNISRMEYTTSATSTSRTEKAAPSLKKMPEGVWIQFPDAQTFVEREKELLQTIADSDGSDDVVIFLKNTKAVKILPPNLRVFADSVLKEKLEAVFGQGNVKYVGIPIENR